MEKLQFITHVNDRYDQLSGAKAALDGGCRWIQLRMKDASESAVIETGHKLRAMCDSYGAILIVDDFAELVNIIGADGVHVGKNDMPVSEVRRLLGQDKIIGATANTFEDLRSAYDAGADYVGVGPFRFTTTKKKLSPVLGLDGYRDIIRQCKENSIVIPIVAIGGITCDDISDIMSAGVSGIAVSGAIINAGNPVDETRKFLNKTIL